MKGLNRKVKFGVIGVICIFAILTAVLYLARSTIVVVAHIGDDNIYNEDSFQILNPFRDRQYEGKAEKFFYEFQAHCESALRGIDNDSDHVQYTCQGESIHPLIAWHLRARKEESSSSILLRYEVIRYRAKDSTTKISDPFWLRLRKANNSEWQVISYETWY